MKKLILSAVMLIGLVFGANAQRLKGGQGISKNAIGVRLSTGDGMGVDASYQRAILTNNRLEFNLGVRNDRNFDGVKLAALFQWTWNIDRGLNWYVGAGGGAGTYRYSPRKGYYDDYYYDNYPYNNRDDKGTYVFLSGDAGIEYDFNIPLQIAFDIRPEVRSGGDYRNDSVGADVGLAVRYRF